MEGEFRVFRRYLTQTNGLTQWLSAYWDKTAPFVSKAGSMRYWVSELAFQLCAWRIPLLCLPEWEGTKRWMRVLSYCYSWWFLGDLNLKHTYRCIFMRTLIWVLNYKSIKTTSMFKFILTKKKCCEFIKGSAFSVGGKISTNEVFLFALLGNTRKISTLMNNFMEPS